MTRKERDHVRKERTAGFFSLRAPGKGSPGSATPKTKTVLLARIDDVLDLYSGGLELRNQYLVDGLVKINPSQQLLVTLRDKDKDQ